MSELEVDSLKQRVRDGMLLDTYGDTLTDKQRTACAMVLLQDLSLAEAGNILGVSRQGVHDLVTRAKEHMEKLESELALIERDNRLESVSKLLEDNKSNLPEDFYKALRNILEA